MDLALTHALNAFLARHDGVEDPVLAYERVAELLFLAMLLAACLAPAVRRAAVAAGLSAALGLVAAQGLAKLVERPRPFVAHPDAVHLLARHAADPGFPSDHATAAFAIGVALLLRHRRWGAAVLVAAGVLAAGRVGMGVHYPSDVLAGAGLGALAALGLHAPPLRLRLDRLADAAGRPADAARRRLQAIVHPQETGEV